MSSTSPLRVLVVDDEELARQRLHDLVAARDDLTLVGLASNGQEAVEVIDEKNPDLVFLDVQMPGLTGIEVVEEVGPDEMPLTIFVTAYDQYALDAFEVAALDYLVKPFDDGRFNEALNRAKERMRLEEMDDVRGHLEDLIEARGASDQPSPSNDEYIERLAVAVRGKTLIISVDDLQFIEAEGPYAELHTRDGDTHLIRERMKTLEERLNPEDFFRIHRSTIVRLDEIQALLHSSGGSYAVRLENGIELRVSRGRWDELKERLGIDAVD